MAFLFSDVEGSTKLWLEHGEEMEESLRLHDEIVRGAIEDRGGYVFTTAGDSFAAAFSDAVDAIAAANEAQAALESARWPGPVLRVRMGLHEARCEPRGGDYFGPDVNLAARVEAAGHGGQVLATQQILSYHDGPVVDLGSHHLVGFDEPVRIFQLGEGRHPDLRTAETTTSTLPATRGELIGRGDELARVGRLLGESRIVTLTGVGGAGKTRLAIEAARERLPHFPGGVFFVDLASVDTPAAIGAAVAAGTGLPAVGPRDQVSALANQLAGTRVLVVVDNCEHLIEDAAELIDDLVTRVPGVSVLATSRESLELDGERTYRVPSLAGGVDGPATHLFVERAMAAHDRFELRPGDEAEIAAICEQLDGMPLAIELAASRVRVLSVPELRQRLDDRFALLSGGRRRSRQRQQTLEATISWSYDLLEPAEQAMLRRLSIFRDGFDIVDVAGVTGFAEFEAVDLVEALAAKSLVEPVDRWGAPGHRLLESIRIFALERLIEAGETQETRDRHLAHFSTAPARTFRSEGEDAPDLQEIERAGREAQNLFAAFQWALETKDISAVAGVAHRSNVWTWDAATIVALTRVFYEFGPNDEALAIVLGLVRSGLNMFPWVAAELGTEIMDATQRTLREDFEGRLTGDGTRMSWGDFGFNVIGSGFPVSAGSIVAAYERHGFDAETIHQRWAAALWYLLGLHYIQGAVAAARRCDELLAERPSEDTLGPMFRTIPVAYTYCLAGRAEDARRILEETTVWPPADVVGGASGPIAWALLDLTEGRPDAAGQHLAEAIARRTVPLSPGQPATYLGLYAWIALVTGDQARAESLIDFVTPRFPWDFLVCCHAKARIARWPDDEFHARATQWHDDLSTALVRGGEARMHEMASALDTEIARWLSMER